MANKKYKKQSKKQLAAYEKIVVRNREFILNKEGVVSFGVGYKTVNGQRTNTICLLVYVEDKKKVARKNLIPKTIEDIPTDVVEVPVLLPEEPEERAALLESSPGAAEEDLPPDEITEALPEAQAPASGPVPECDVHVPSSSRPLADRIPNLRYETLMGGVIIHNPNTGRDRVGMLGAIVFDKATDKPLGLSVAHAIGNQVGNKYDDYKRAIIGDPINQPPGPADGNDIGTLIDFDKDYDAAIFQINDKRKVAPKIKGGPDSEDFELREPITPRVGMQVECPARSDHATGVIISVMSRFVGTNRFGSWKFVDMVYIRFDKNSPLTKSGDSGSIWLEIGSKRPIGLHRGVARYPNEARSVAAATSMVQLTKWHPFKFSPPISAILRPRVSEYDSSFVKLKKGWLAFCWQPQNRSLVIKKFDAKFQNVGDVNMTKPNDIRPLSGIGATKLGNNIHAVWRGPKDKIHWAKMSKTDSLIGDPIRLKFETHQKPALVSFNDQLVMAYTDADRQRLNIAICKDGKRFSHLFEITNAKTEQSPALLALSDKIFLCWVRKSDNRIVVAELYPSGDSFSVSYWTIWYQAAGDPALAAGAGKIFLGYTSLKGELRVLESRYGWWWKTKSIDSSISNSHPCLVFVDNELISWRPGGSSKAP